MKCPQSPTNTTNISMRRTSRWFDNNVKNDKTSLFVLDSNWAMAVLFTIKHSSVRCTKQFCGYFSIFCSLFLNMHSLAILSSSTSKVRFLYSSTVNA